MKLIGHQKHLTYNVFMRIVFQAVTRRRTWRLFFHRKRFVQKSALAHLIILDVNINRVYEATCTNIVANYSISRVTLNNLLKCPGVYCKLRSITMSLADGSKLNGDVILYTDVTIKSKRKIS